MECVQCAYTKVCSLSRSHVVKMEALLLYFPLIWIKGSIKETSELAVIVESSIEKFKKSSVSFHLYFIKTLSIGNNMGLMYEGYLFQGPIGRGIRTTVR